MNDLFVPHLRHKCQQHQLSMTFSAHLPVADVEGTVSQFIKEDRAATKKEDVLLMFREGPILSVYSRMGEVKLSRDWLALKKPAERAKETLQPARVQLALNQ